MATEPNAAVEPAPEGSQPRTIPSTATTAPTQDDMSNGFSEQA